MRDLRQAAERLLDALEVAFMHSVDLSHHDEEPGCTDCAMVKVLRSRMEELGGHPGREVAG